MQFLGQVRKTGNKDTAKDIRFNEFINQITLRGLISTDGTYDYYNTYPRVILKVISSVATIPPSSLH